MIRPARSILPLLVLALVALCARAASAQAPFPGAVQPDPVHHPDQWVPCSHPIAITAGKGCAAPTPAPVPVAAPVPAPTQFDPDCQNLNPYADPDKAAECGRRPLPGASTPQFEVGGIYCLGYTQLRAVVIGLAKDPQGVQVVTFAWLPESQTDGVLAVRTPPTPGGRTNWISVGR